MKLPAAYCKLHKAPLTWRQIRYHGCMSTRKQRGGKQHCRHFVKDESHPAWEERRRRIEEKKARRMQKIAGVL